MLDLRRFPSLRRKRLLFSKNCWSNDGIAITPDRSFIYQLMSIKVKKTAVLDDPPTTESLSSVRTWQNLINRPCVCVCLFGGVASG